MKLYRVIQSDDDIKNEDFSGVNTFEYTENEEYLHFFVLPEHAEIYKQLKYKFFLYKRIGSRNWKF